MTWFVLGVILGFILLYHRQLRRMYLTHRVRRIYAKHQVQPDNDDVISHEEWVQLRMGVMRV